MRFKLPFTTDRGDSAAKLSTRLDSAPSVETPPVSAAPDSDAMALEIGRRVMREMATGAPPATMVGPPSAAPHDPFAERRGAQESRIQSLRDTMEARASAQAEALQPLRDALSAAQTTYDTAFAEWQASPTRLAVVQADELLEQARSEVNDQERRDREELAVLAVQIERLQSEMQNWLTELGGRSSRLTDENRGFQNWKVSAGATLGPGGSRGDRTWYPDETFPRGRNPFGARPPG